MTKQKTDISNVQAGTTAIITGNVTFSRIARPFEGEDLKKQNLRNKYPKENPYQTITVENPQIMCNNPILAQRLKEECYGKKTYPGKLFFQIDKSITPQSYPLRFGHKDKEKNSITEIAKLEGELSIGSQVQLILKTYFSKKRNGICIGLDFITILDEEIKYYEGGDIAKTMAEIGMIFNPAPENTQDDNYEAIKENYVNNEYNSMEIQPLPYAPSTPEGNQFSDPPKPEGVGIANPEDKPPDPTNNFGITIPA